MAARQCYCLSPHHKDLFAGTSGSMLMSMISWDGLVCDSILLITDRILDSLGVRGVLPMLFLLQMQLSQHGNVNANENVILGTTK